MIYSFRIEQAIRAAAILHRDQVRKGRAPYPYVAHLYAVASIIRDYTSDEDTIISGLLHDTLEDTDYTIEELEKDFGPRVRTIVEHVSERISSDDTRSREERKRGYILMLKKAPEESLIVAAADKIHNLRSIVEEYHGAFEDYLRDFNGTIPERLEFYGALHSILNSKLQNAIIHEFNHVFDEFQSFIRIHDSKQ